MKRSLLLLIIIFLLIISGFMQYKPVNAQEPVIQAVLFYSPSCPHCLEVINEVLPPLVNQYGTQLEIFGVNTYTEKGGLLFDEAMEIFAIPPSDRGVPTLIVGDQLLMGSFEIPEKLPGIISEGLDQGGIPYPEIPGLSELREEMSGGSAEQSTSPDTDLSLREKFMGDLAGNTLSVIALIIMISVLIQTGLVIQKNRVIANDTNLFWLVPVLAVIGIGVASYLAFVEFTRTEAVCGPVGRCNTVQQSPYAMLFGVLPVGFLGLLGYLAVLFSWLMISIGPEKWRKEFAFLLWFVTLFGTGFSIYLTFLEPFVIGASCMWCLGSALIMAILLVLTTRNALKHEVFRRKLEN